MHALCVHPGGEYVFTAISSMVVVYNTADGEVAFKPLKSCNEVINALAINKDGSVLATGSSDRICVIFTVNIDNLEKLLEPVLRFQMGDSINVLCFSPLTNQLFIASSTDYSMYTPSKQNIAKERFNEKIISGAWSPDGMLLAVGTMDGSVLFKDKALKTRHEVRRLAPAWCMAWTPFSVEHDEVLLLVGFWDQSLVYFNREGQVIVQKKIAFDPLRLTFYSNSSLILISGNDRKCYMYTRELHNLEEITTTSDWCWTHSFMPHSQDLILATNDGKIISL